MKKEENHWLFELPGFTIMDRYITLELLLPFFFGMGLFTSLALSIGSVFDMVRRVTEQGLPAIMALEILGLKLPGFIVLAFPMAILLAALMGYSRLTNDNELIALQSLGIQIHRMVAPGIILSLVITFATFCVSDWVAPAANYQASLILQKGLTGSTLFKQNNIIYPEYTKIKEPDGHNEDYLSRLFYADKFDGKQMLGLTILDLSQKGVNQIVTADSASWNIAENRWDFYNGTIYIIAPDGSYQNIVRFTHQQLQLPRGPLDSMSNDVNYEDLSIQDAREYLKILKLSNNQKKIRKLEVRIQEKIALPWVCLVFGIIGTGLGLIPKNNNRATSFGICIGLIFAHYLASFLTGSMGIWGILSPTMAAWLPNILGLGAGITLLNYASRQS